MARAIDKALRFMPPESESQARQSGVKMNIQGSQRMVPLVFTLPDGNGITMLNNNLLNLSVSFSMDGASALSFEIIDPGFQMAARNYFQIGQTIYYQSRNIQNLITKDKNQETNFSGAASYWAYPFELASVDVSQEQGYSPIWRIQAYTKAIQQMKRDRKPGSIKGDGKVFVENAARKYGLIPVVQKTSKSQRITSASGDKAADSVWDVLVRLAQESKDEKGNQFMCFESDGTLYMGSQNWLLHKWGVDSYRVLETITKEINGKKTKIKRQVTRYCTKLTYPRTTTGLSKHFEVLKLPSISKSDNDPLEGNGSLVVERTNGVRLRPGMTVYVGDIPYLNGYYLIDSVNFNELSPDPVSVSFRTPERQEKYIKQIQVGPILAPRIGSYASRAQQPPSTSNTPQNPNIPE